MVANGVPVEIEVGHPVSLALTARTPAGERLVALAEALVPALAAPRRRARP